MNAVQPGILGDVPRLARYLTFDLKHGVDASETLKTLAEAVDGDAAVVGLGESLVLSLNQTVDGLRNFPSHVARAVTVPATPAIPYRYMTPLIIAGC